jgi:hypothetical protein
MSNSHNNSTTTLERGIRQEDVAALVEGILQDDAMKLPLVPDLVQRTIYESTIQLSFNLVYQTISQLEGIPLVEGKVLHLQRLLGTHPHRFRWQSFPPTTMDMQPLEQLASVLLQNQAVNQTVIPDAVEKKLYINCLKIIFWVLHIITTNLRVTFCGHTLSLQLTPVQTSRGGGENTTVRSFIQDISALVNPQTMEKFSRRAQALLFLETDPSRPATSGVKGGLAFLKSSLNKVQEEMIRKLHQSLYALLLAIVDDLMRSTQLEVLNDAISFRVGHATSPTSGSTTGNDQDNPKLAELDEVSVAVEATLGSLEFSQQRAILANRFRDFSPEERAMILRDLGGA